MNSVLVAMWTAGGISLGYFAGHTLINACDEDNWGQEGAGGHLVCRTYKGLFAFFTICAIILDVRVRQKQTSHKYQNLHDPDRKTLITRHEDDPWSMEMAPPSRPDQRYYQHAKYEPIGNDGGMAHGRTPSEQPVDGAHSTHDTSYQGAGAHAGEAAGYYDLHGAGPPQGH
ncbi:MAG: hypothetical protein Q9159_001474 [Coniocarpon cinnabarinum]